MQFARRGGALIIAVFISTAAFAQTAAPVAVPLVGSPAAQTPASATTPPVAQPSSSASQIPAIPPQMPPQTAPASVGVPATRGERKLDLAFSNGTISLDAQNVSLREIVGEWQRRGGCQFVHAEQLPAAPVTLQLPAGTPELQAIDSLFRNLATPNSGYGYIVAPAANQTANKSSCGAVYILAASRPIATSPYAGAVTMPSPVVAPIAIGSPDDEIPPVTPFGPIQRPQPTVPGAAAGPNQANPGVNSAPVPSAPAQPSFAPIAPAVPGAGRIGAAPTPTPPQPNGNPQSPQTLPNGSGR
jgi:hypothetical protein